LSKRTPTYFWSIPQASPNHQYNRNSFINCWWGVWGKFQGVGKFLDILEGEIWPSRLPSWQVKVYNSFVLNYPPEKNISLEN